jgi:hypothetical protein
MDVHREWGCNRLTTESFSLRDRAREPRRSLPIRGLRGSGYGGRVATEYVLGSTLYFFLPIHRRARGDLQPWAFENISVTQVVFSEFSNETTRAGFYSFYRKLRAGFYGFE